MFARWKLFCEYLITNSLTGKLNCLLGECGRCWWGVVGGPAGFD